MKQTFLIVAAVGLSLHGMAQDTYVTSAKVALSSQKLDEAKEDIDKAMASPETKEKPKALLAKAQIYFAMQESDKYKASSPYKEGTQAIIKLIEVKPDYEKSTADQYLLRGGYYYYNDGVRAYNDKKLNDAADDMREVVKIYNMKRMDKLPADQAKRIDTVAANANQILASSAYYLAKYDEAVPLLTSAKNNPITRIPSVYECLIDAYNRLDKKTDALATIQEARKAFPDDVTIRNYELNYYITSGKDDEMLKKLEEAAAKEPNNADLQFNLATTYERMAGTKDKKATNSAELITKSEESFQKALKLSPNNAEYNYNFGALYYNQATDYNEQMNAITGTSDADQKKYDNFKSQRDAMFAKASPYFEAARSQYATNEKDLKDADRKTYKNTLKALMEIYSRLSQMDKYADAKKKYESL